MGVGRRVKRRRGRIMKEGNLIVLLSKGVGSKIA